MRPWSRAIDDSALRNVKVLTHWCQYSPEVSGPFFAHAFVVRDGNWYKWNTTLVAGH